MDLRKVYAECGGDYEDVIGRLITEERVERFVKKFADSTDYDMLMEAVAQKDHEGIFRYSHNLKGLSLNLSFTELQKSSSELCELFRNGAPTEDYSEVLERVTRDRKRVVDAIRSNE